MRRRCVSECEVMRDGSVRRCEERWKREESGESTEREREKAERKRRESGEKERRDRESEGYVGKMMGSGG